jgi:hypothetical protein
MAATKIKYQLSLVVFVKTIHLNFQLMYVLWRAKQQPCLANLVAYNADIVSSVPCLQIMLMKQ